MTLSGKKKAKEKKIERKEALSVQKLCWWFGRRYVSGWCNGLNREYCKEFVIT